MQVQAAGAILHPGGLKIVNAYAPRKTKRCTFSGYKSGGATIRLRRLFAVSGVGAEP
jgi:hypothetical protein